MKAGETEAAMTTAMATTADAERVLAYLRAMEDRDLPKAQGLLHRDFVMVFPGNARMSDLAALVEFSRTRYRSVRKTFEETDLGLDRRGRPVVVCCGTLRGEWLDGTAFSDIRFVDRFVLCDGLILEQHVWNDIADTLRAAGR
jgi:hypothetical protein